jgi:hypothetical protein
MKSIRNSKLGYYNTLLLLQEADELARSWKWTRDFALYIMFCKAMAAGDKVRGEAIMELLESEVLTPLHEFQEA